MFVRSCSCWPPFRAVNRNFALRRSSSDLLMGEEKPEVPENIWLEACLRSYHICIMYGPSTGVRSPHGSCSGLSTFVLLEDNAVATSTAL